MTDIIFPCDTLILENLLHKGVSQVNKL
uniref:Uncharacterized protein n=1 Tax=Anguilla anguilla TaxID=7936 RepID=A0A0E9QAG4_ANGAN